jgi:predicted TIM-barrel fold metal-dependent hydrolase
VTQANNDGISAFHQAHPDRFAGFALLPIADMDAAVAEFHRAMGLPGMVGAILPGNGFLLYSDAEAFRPLFEAAQQYNAIMLIHTGPMPGEVLWPPDESIDNRWVRQGTLDMQARVSSAMVTICLTDFLEKYPGVTVMSHNLGGNIPFEVERMDHLVTAVDPDAELPSKRFREAKLVIDCNSLGERAMERGVEVYGVDKIVLGTDGSAFSMDWSMKALKAARLDEADKRAILDDNAKAILAPLLAA